MKHTTRNAVKYHIETQVLGSRYFSLHPSPVGLASCILEVLVRGGLVLSKRPRARGNCKGHWLVGLPQRRVVVSSSLNVSFEPYDEVCCLDHSH